MVENVGSYSLKESREEFQKENLDSSFDLCLLPSNLAA